MIDDIAVWLRERGTLMVNAGDQFTVLDGERLLEAADEIERLRAVQKAIGDEATARLLSKDAEIERLRAVIASAYYTPDDDRRTEILETEVTGGGEA